MSEPAKVMKRSRNLKKVHKPPIFYDNTGIRGKAFLAFVVVSFLVFLFIQWKAYNLIFTNDNPSRLLANSIDKSINFSSPNLTETTNALKEKYPSKLSDSKRVAFYVTWNESSLISLKKNVSNIDILIPEFLAVSTGDTFKSIDSEDEKYVVAYAKKENPEIKILPLINNYNSERSTFDFSLINNILNNSAAKEKFISDLHDYVLKNNLDGINIDFEDIPLNQHRAYIAFMRDLNAKFKSSDLMVTQDVPFANPDYNYSEYAKHSDYLIFMAYDYNWSTGRAGPIAPATWFNTSLSRIQNTTPPEKVIIALGGYGYSWIGDDAQATNRTYHEVLQIAKDNNATIELDPASLNMFFKYSNELGVENTVWFLDAVTFYNQTVEVNKYPYAGVAIWRLGSEDQKIWGIMKDPANPFDTVSSLTEINHGFAKRVTGLGEISKVQTLPRAGQRNISIDSNTGKITKQEIISFPVSYTIQKWGGEKEKKVALTFDDGPDPVYTREINKILKENDIKATFFIVGRQANVNPNILKELYSDGHEIGNHTYLHSNIGKSSFNSIFPELNATQLLIKNITGHKSFLFRAPFRTNYEIGDDGENLISEGISDLGFYDVGVNVDPRDWLVADSQIIAEEVINRVLHNESNSVVLLHDGGGNRSSTVEALPKIISELKKEGYTFVTTSELMNVEKSAIMPLSITPENMGISFENIEFSIITFIVQFFSTLFVWGILIGILKSLITVVFAIINRTREVRFKFSSSYLPKVSVIVPAWNEEKVIKKTVNTLLKNLYPRLEIIVVDDGSTDNTYQVAYQEYRDNPKVRVLTTIVNGGKSSAINFAVRRCRSSIFIVQDADTVLAPDSILKLVRHMKDQKVAAVAGNVKVGNRINLITRFQALEYIISQNLDRRAFHLLNAISVVPGAIGAWRKKVVLKAGGFHSDTLAEDAELTLRILRLGYKIENEPDAIGYTEAPDNFKIFVKQRFRWMFGTLQAIWKVRHATFSVKNRSLGFVVIPNVFIFQIVLSILSPFLDLYVIGSVIFTVWQKNVNPEMSFDTLNNILVFYLVFVVLDIITGVAAFYMEKRESKMMLIWIPFQRLFHKYVMYFVSLKAIFTAINGPHVKWEIKNRAATVNELIALGEN